MQCNILPNTSYLVLKSLWLACYGRLRLPRWLWQAEAAVATVAALVAVASWGCWAAEAAEAAEAAKAAKAAKAEEAADEAPACNDFKGWSVLIMPYVINTFLTRGH